jgi:hypothetical protein
MICFRFPQHRRTPVYLLSITTLLIVGESMQHTVPSRCPTPSASRLAPEQASHEDAVQAQPTLQTAPSPKKRKQAGDRTSLAASKPNEVSEPMLPAQILEHQLQEALADAPPRDIQDLPPPLSSAAGHSHNDYGSTRPSLAPLLPVADSATTKSSSRRPSPTPSLSSVCTPITPIKPNYVTLSSFLPPVAECTHIEPDGATPCHSPNQLAAASRTSILEDLAPERRLRGGTLHSLIRTFIPPTVFRVAEVRDTASIRTWSSPWLRLCVTSLHQ